MEIEKMNKEENAFYELVDGATGAHIKYTYYHDPELQWIRLKNGDIHLHARYDGSPTTEWLNSHPRPKG